MKVVLQRVSEATCVINNILHASISKGMLILVGFEEQDTAEDLTWMCNKLLNLRIFSDEAGLMNLSIQDINGEVMIISQFTLFASTKKGNRPSFIEAAKPAIAIPLYEQFIAQCNNSFNKEVATGIFGADMKISLTNDGPVTIIIDSKNKI